MFKVALRLRDQYVFMWYSLKYLFLVEITKIENAAFPHKTAQSKSNVKDK